MSSLSSSSSSAPSQKTDQTLFCASSTHHVSARTTRANDESPVLVLRERLRTARKAAKLTQAQLARLAGIDRSTYVHIERGDRNPSFKAAAGIAPAPGRSIEDLLLPCDVLMQHNDDQAATLEPTGT